jgi:hypothetical protein
VDGKHTAFLAEPVVLEGMLDQGLVLKHLATGAAPLRHLGAEVRFVARQTVMEA